MSGLIAHFLFGANSSWDKSPQQERYLASESGPGVASRAVVSRRIRGGSPPRGARARWRGPRVKETMAVRLDEIRKAAERVAASHALDVVDVEFAGSEKDRILRVYL